MKNENCKYYKWLKWMRFYQLHSHWLKQLPRNAMNISPILQMDCTFELYVLFLQLISHSGHKQLVNLFRENRKFYVLQYLLKESTLVHDYNWFYLFGFICWKKKLQEKLTILATSLFDGRYQIDINEISLT